MCCLAPSALLTCLKCVAVCCNVLQCDASVLQCVAVCCSEGTSGQTDIHVGLAGKRVSFYNTPPYIATHCIILQHTATHCIILQHIATHINTLQHVAIQPSQQDIRMDGSQKTRCNTLQRTTNYILQYTATHCNTLLTIHYLDCPIKLCCYQTKGSPRLFTATHCNTELRLSSNKMGIPGFPGLFTATCNTL